MLIFKALKRDIEFRKKCMITLGILILIRIFCSIPTLGVNAEYFKTILQENTSLGFLNTLTGNGLSSLCRNVTIRLKNSFITTVN